MRSRFERVTEWIDWFLRVVGVTSLIVVLILFDEMRDQDSRERVQNTCQAMVNAAQAQRSINLDHELTVEREAERRADDALTAVVRGIRSRPAPTQAEGERLFTELHNALAAQSRARIEADKARAENPPVPVPDQVC